MQTFQKQQGNTDLFINNASTSTEDYHSFNRKDGNLPLISKLSYNPFVPQLNTELVIVGGNAKCWTDDNGIQFMNIYDSMLKNDGI